MASSPHKLPFRVLAGLIAAAGVTFAGAQGITSHRDTTRSNLAAGAVYLRHQESRPAGLTIIESVEMDPSSRMGAQWRVSSRSTTTINQHVESMRALSTLVLDDALRPVRSEAGLTFWPPAAPLFVVYRDSASEFRFDAPTAPAIATTSRGTTFTIALGRVDRATDASVVFALDLPANDPMRDFRGSRLFRLEATAPNTVARVLDGRSVTSEQRELRLVPISAVSSLLPDQAFLVWNSITKSPPMETAIQVSVPIPSWFDSAEVVLSGGAPLLRAGAPTPDPAPEESRLPTSWTILAVDPVRGASAVVHVPKRGRSALGLTREQAISWLAEAGYSDAIALPYRENATIPDARREELLRERGGIAARRVLVLAPTREATAGEPGTIKPGGLGFHSIKVSGTSVGLSDRRTRLTAGLDSYFEATMAPEDRDKDGPRVELRLPEPAIVREMEFVHAQTVGFSPEFNLKSVRIDARETMRSPWVPVGGFTNATPVERQRVRLSIDKPVEELRIVFLAPSFMPEGKVARISELTLRRESAP